MSQQLSFSKRRKWANGALAFSFLLYVITVFLNYQLHDSLWLRLLYSIAEAALVGGVADWFAVTALFRKPLGISYHTALIPRNRQRLAKAIANMVQNELLSEQSLKEKMQKIHLVKLFIFFIEKRRGNIIIVEMIKKIIRYFFSFFPKNFWVCKGRDFVFRQFMRDDILSFICKNLQDLVRKGRAEPIILFFLQHVKHEATLPNTKQKIELFLEKQSNSFTEDTDKEGFGWLKSFLFESAKAFNMINFSDAAAALQQELVTSLEEIEDPQHPIRKWISEEVNEFLERIIISHDSNENFSIWIKELLDQLDIEKMITSFFDQISCDLDNKQLYYSPITAYLLLQLDRWWQEFLKNEQAQKEIEEKLQAFLQSLLQEHHQAIGHIVYEVMDRLSNNALNHLIEEKVGADLQWVRINGTIIGGVVGLFLFLFVEYIYFPYILTYSLPFQ